MKNLILILLVLIISACGEPVSQPKAMLAEKLDCPEGSLPEIERWGGLGENGWLQACKMKHGLFTAWHGEVKAVAWVYSGIRERSVFIPIGWDEKQPFHPWKPVNFLTDKTQRDPISDQTNLKSLLCRVRKVASGSSR